MLSPIILLTAVINGLMTGAIYALVALGLTLIYGVLHIINFAHGALLSAALFAAFFAYQKLGLDPYLSLFLVLPLVTLAAAFTYKLLIAPVILAPEHNQIVVTLGLFLFVINGITVWLVTAFIHGVHGDNNATFEVGEVSEEAHLLVERTRESLDRAIKAVKLSGKPINCPVSCWMENGKPLRSSSR